MSAKTITFDFNFWKHKRPFRKPSVAEIQKIEDKCSYYSKAGYDAFMTGSVFIGLCKHISESPSYSIIEGQNQNLHKVGSLRHLNARPQWENHVRNLFGRNKVSRGSLAGKTG